MATRVQWYGGSASVDCSATIIARQLDATQYFNHTRYTTGNSAKEFKGVLMAGEEVFHGL